MITVSFKNSENVQVLERVCSNIEVSGNTVDSFFVSFTTLNTEMLFAELLPIFRNTLNVESDGSLICSGVLRSIMVNIQTFDEVDNFSYRLILNI